MFVVVDAAHPWAADGHATTAQHNRPVLAAVALGGAGTVVLALWSREVGDLGGHQLAMTSNPTAVEVANSPFAHVLGEASEVVLDAAASCSGSPLIPDPPVSG